MIKWFQVFVFSLFENPYNVVGGILMLSFEKFKCSRFRNFECLVLGIKMVTLLPALNVHIKDQFVNGFNLRGI